MRLDEHTAKDLLALRGFRIPRGRAVTSADDAARVAREVGGAVVLKPQILAGKRGKAGLIRFAEGESEARREAAALLERPSIDRLRVEEKIAVERELYVAVTSDTSRRCPVVLFSTEGGVDVESVDSIDECPVDIRQGLHLETARRMAGGAIAPLLVELYRFYREVNAELVEINPLAVTLDNELTALDAKLVVDDSALARHPELPRSRPTGTALELEANAAGLYYIELEGDLGVLANGAGLTMATLDAIRFFGGAPANFMEIGGDAYRKAETALSIVLGNPRVKSLLVNLCGAYARTDVMIEGFLRAWESLSPAVPVSISIRGTGQEKASRLVRDELGLTPAATMDEAVRMAIAATRGQ